MDDEVTWNIAISSKNLLQNYKSSQQMNAMWNNPVSSQEGLHTSHRTEHDIWSFTDSVHPYANFMSQKLSCFILLSLT